MEKPQDADPRQAGGYGPTLAAAVPVHGPLPVRSVLTMAARLADTLSAAHSAGIIHLGLGPASVLLAPEGPRLIDPGISLAAHPGQAAPAGALPGLHDFTPPERATGREAGPASDMFCLGAVLLYAATGAWMSHFAVHLDQLPGELRPFIERCLAAEPARRPTAAGFRAELAATHPEAVGHAAWPGGIPARGTAPYGVWPPPAGTPAWTSTREPAPRKPRKTWNTPKARRRAGVITTAALAFAVAGAGAVYVIHPWPYPVLRPAGLTADQRGTTSISLGWSNPASGPLPDKYVILQDGAVAATVPGNVNHFKDDGLVPKTTYDFRVIAYRGSVHSPSSLDLRATTQTPPLSEAVFNTDISVAETLAAGGDSVSGEKDGTSQHDDWLFTGNCPVGPCETQLTGSLDSYAFNAVLRSDGNGDYTGTVDINDYWTCGANNFTDSTLTITVQPTSAEVATGQWQAVGFTGYATWDISASTAGGGCASGVLMYKVAG